MRSEGGSLPLSPRSCSPRALIWAFLTGPTLSDLHEPLQTPGQTFSHNLWGRSMWLNNRELGKVIKLVRRTRLGTINPETFWPTPIKAACCHCRDAQPIMKSDEKTPNFYLQHAKKQDLPLWNRVWCPMWGQSPATVQKKHVSGYPLWWKPTFFHIPLPAHQSQCALGIILSSTSPDSASQTSTFI